MKRIVFCLAAVSALLLSCQQKDEPQQPQVPVTLHCMQPAYLK